MSSILQYIATSLSNKHAFVVYKKPQNPVVNGLFQKSSDLHFIENYNEKGFVFAPFDDAYKSVLIPISEAELIQQTWEMPQKSVSNNNIVSLNADKKEHTELIKKTKEAIEIGRFKKIVVSRQELVLVSEIDLISAFNNLIHLYPNAFVYVWHHPKVGTWLGASPETLLKVENGNFVTMSLAGTQKYQKGKKIVWQEKEIREQQYVTDFLTTKINPICKSISLSNTKTIQAGSLVHLQTMISGQLLDTSESLKKLINVVHPTPAVCGVPKQASKEFILKNENYQRTFYTGYLGELNMNTSDVKQNASFYVNLRCAEIQENTIKIFVGGGITIDSNVEKEWEETVYKSAIIKSVL